MKKFWDNLPEWLQAILGIIVFIIIVYSFPRLIYILGLIFYYGSYVFFGLLTIILLIDGIFMRDKTEK